MKTQTNKKPTTNDEEIIKPGGNILMINICE